MTAGTIVVLVVAVALLAAQWLWLRRRRDAGAEANDQVEASRIPYLENSVSGLTASFGALADEVRHQLSSVQASVEGGLRSVTGQVERGNALAEVTVRHTEQLRATLGANHLRGQIGEAALANLLSASGVTFETQVTSSDVDTGRDRPDAIVALPDGAALVIDSKFPTIPDNTPDDQQAKVLAESFRRASAELARKRYQDRVPGSVPFVVMLVPQPGALAGVEHARPGSLRTSIDAGVVPADPSTLPSLLALAAALGRMWRLPSEWTETSEALVRLHGDEAALRKNLNVVRDAVHTLVPALRDAMSSLAEADETMVVLSDLTGQPGVRSLKKVGVRLRAPAALGDCQRVLPVLDGEEAVA